jgi:hypothetical protein
MPRRVPISNRVRFSNYRVGPEGKSTMKKLTLIAGIAVLSVPAISHAQLGLRLGLENPIYTHFDNNGRSGYYTIGDTWQPAVNVLAEFYPIGNIGIGLELIEGFASTGGRKFGPPGEGRTGTFLGPNLTVDFVPLPLYVRGSLPIHLEPDIRYMNLRLAGGLKIGIPLASLYVEVTSDFPLFGDSFSPGGGGVTPFSRQQFGVGAGLWFKL